MLTEVVVELEDRIGALADLGELLGGEGVNISALAVVDTTIQPTEAWLWLRPPRQPSGTASLPQPDVVIQSGGARRHVGPRPLPPDGRDRHHRRRE